MRHADVVRKTQAQITAALGPSDPSYTSTDSDGTVPIVHTGPLGDGYRIDLRDGVAVNTMDLTK